MKRMENYVSGAVIQRIVLKDFKLFPLTLPTSNLQTLFNEHVSDYMNQSWKSNEQIRTLSKLRDILLPKLISGELALDDLPEDIAEAAEAV